MKRAVAAARGISEKKTSNRTPPVWRKTATDFGEKAAKEQEGGGEKGSNEEEKNFTNPFKSYLLICTADRALVSF